MSNVILADLLSNGDNESIKEISVKYPTSEEAISENDIIGNSKVPSSLPGSNNLLWMSNLNSLKTRPDIDVDYAIELLRKEEQNINVYSHMQGIIDKILLDRPENPLEKFELYSQILKRSYIHKEYNFEHVFEDNINRDGCRKSLQIFRCAMKNQSEKQKQHIKNDVSGKKSKILNVGEKIVINDSNVSETHVQDLSEINYMFNKAGCGLSNEEVSLISITMNSMARLNKFKDVRFWGKIFGIKKTYFIIECEWTRKELHRKILMKRMNSESLSQGKQKLNSVTKQCSPQAQLDFSSKRNKDEVKNEAKSVEKPSQEQLFESTITTLKYDATDDDSSIVSNDSRISLSETESFKTQLLDTVSTEIPAEMFGIGANRKVFFVTNDLNRKWTELDLVHPHHITEARKIKRYFTGNMLQPINSFPQFKGLERDYLRAQIARISASTQICPQGYYEIDKKENDKTELLDFQSPVSSDLSKMISFDLIKKNNLKPIPITNLINSNFWVHKNPRIENNGITKKPDFPPLYKSRGHNAEESENIEEEVNFSYVDDTLIQKDELFGNLKTDITIDGTTPAWKGILCFPFDPSHSCTVMKSHVWPGAYAVTYKSDTDYVYIGWAQKHDSIGYGSSLIGELRMENLRPESLREFEDPTRTQENTNPRKNVMKGHFLSKRNRKVYKGNEKILVDYTYDL